MRVRTVVAATAALSLCVVLAGGAQARTARPVPASARGRAAHIERTGSAVLYSQMDNDSGAATVSQNFEPANDAADSQGADSFTVPGHTTWAIKKVLAPGQYFNGATLGPADSETVTFYANSGGLPGAVVKSLTKVGSDTNGSFSIPIRQVSLTHGKYWVSVQVNMALLGHGEWGWETRTVKSGPGAAWQNPGDIFGTGCTSYARLTACLGDGPDFMFQLNGVSSPS